MSNVSIVATWVCTHCHRGWPSAPEPPPSCSACGRRAQQRGVVQVVDLDPISAATGSAAPLRRTA